MLRSMLRRVVSFLMLPCLLLTQSASVAHGHGKDTPVGHESRPHVHLALAAAVLGETHEHGSAHGHSHPAGGHHRHHHDEADEGATPTTASDRSGSGGHGSAPIQTGDHDRDAVFVSSLDAVTSRAGAEFAANELEWLAALAVAVVEYDLLQVTSAPRHPPSHDERASERPLYIRHSALLL